MNGEEIKNVYFFDELVDLFLEYITETSAEDEEFEYTWDDVHSVWVYLYRNEAEGIPCYRDVDIKATILNQKIEEFLEKHKCDNYIDAICLMVLLQQKLSTLLDKYYDQREEEKQNS